MYLHEPVTTVSQGIIRNQLQLNATAFILLPLPLTFRVHLQRLALIDLNGRRRENTTSHTSEEGKWYVLTQ